MRYLVLYDSLKEKEIYDLIDQNKDMIVIEKGFFWKAKYRKAIRTIDTVIVFKSSIQNSENVRWEISKLQSTDMLIILSDMDKEIEIITRATKLIKKVNKNIGNTIRKAAISNTFEGLFKSEIQFEYEKEFMFKMLETSESLINRRQTTNNYMISANAILLTLVGVLFGIDKVRDVIISLLPLPVIGLIISISWCSLLTSFGKLNKAKFEVICFLENRLKIPIFNAEWMFLSKKSVRYKSFTKTEKWLPVLLGVLYVAIIIIIIAIFLSNPATKGVQSCPTIYL